MIDDRASTSGGITDPLLDLVLAATDAATDADAGVDDFLTGLAAHAAWHFARPGRPVSCGISLFQRKKLPLDVGSSGAGAGSTLRIPLALDGGSTAVLELFSVPPGAFSADDAEAAEAFAERASRFLLLALRLARLAESRGDMAAAMQSRTVIDLAVGAIMAQNRCSRAAAFKILRNTSNNRNIKIRDVAASLISSIAGDEDLSPHFDE
ncbi:ANTAR domain-containing protein [Pseudarthrobacter albicanus]|uniref:ANTAR domain-containing protein n=1 Tax=Pseudarthrobacter albicanus TaxID=2823873 RepID=UPI001BA492D7|nr:ANTAR domain-containing protein [Pseudarthrobacter albicanus]